jgi:predicted CoA-substrate-specific enzyme activase
VTDIKKMIAIFPGIFDIKAAGLPVPAAVSEGIRIPAILHGRTPGVNALYLGIDIGSVSVSYVLIDQVGTIVSSAYLFHHGSIEETLTIALSQMPMDQIAGFGYNRKSEGFFSGGIAVNDQVALIDGLHRDHRETGSILTVGAETFGLILFDRKNRYQKFISNSSCAAGTGAFLDQQAVRLGLTDSAKLSELALAYEGDPPRIATRCAVFAKTDLIHCQQQGYDLEAICAGLCRGLARNIADTLLGGIRLRGPVFMAGGVSRNRSVVKNLEAIIGQELKVPENAQILASIGCALAARDAGNGTDSILTARDILRPKIKERGYFYPSLNSTDLHYPDFGDHQSWVSGDVEIDLYLLPEKNRTYRVYMGIDIGSTSTKMVLVENDQVLLGLYTRTQGRPVDAVQRLFREIRNIMNRFGAVYEFIAVGTTGSGRKFIKNVLRADIAVDEITAHARAAYFLDPAIDTIIEIGGQDSKFTVMKNGNVTFSVMNYVCAAGTGSFIEEQAKRLGVPLEEYAIRAGESPAPLTSDRCTVFMERDLNHLLNQGYSRDELLAAALHSVRDNYLAKVAHLNMIGDQICFQGATAKNRALVAAFAQKLRRPLHVSRYCHLTGALGVALILKAEFSDKSAFRGLDFCDEKITVHQKVCGLCNNHCKLNEIVIENETMTWGYLCGRDETGRIRRSLSQQRFDLLADRRKIFRRPGSEGRMEYERKSELAETIARLQQDVNINLLTLRYNFFRMTKQLPPETDPAIHAKIGIPDALYLNEYLPFWEMFFKKTGFEVVLPKRNQEYIKVGRQTEGAEFCAPIARWHGTIEYLKDKVDYIFLPQMFEEGSERYCYYSNYAVALAQNNLPWLRKHAICPTIDFAKSPLENIRAIHEALPTQIRLMHSPANLMDAFQESWDWFLFQRRSLIGLFEEQIAQIIGIKVVLLGRPYIALDPDMNQGLPAKLSRMGIPAYFQDMLPKPAVNSGSPVSEHLVWNHWHFGRTILEAAEYIAQAPDLYPVYLTAFKCSPDSFVIPYFREVMEAYGKPYLILQLDEHGSDVGYDTRLEAAIRSFRNHQRSADTKMPLHPPEILESYRVGDQTVLVPNYDAFSCRLISASFERAGYRTELIEETPLTIVNSLRVNDGQCLPISAIVQSAVETIRQKNLRPENTTIFLNSITQLACNFPQYPLMAKKLLHSLGEGFEKVQIFATDFDLRGLAFEIIVDVYFSYLIGGLLRRLGCRIRPYELVDGMTNRLLRDSLGIMSRTIAGGLSKEAAFRGILGEMQNIPVSGDYGERPKVSIIGDLYVRDNEVFNQSLIPDLERFGAEVITTPFTYLLRILAIKHTMILRDEKQYMKLIRHKVLIEILEKLERKFYRFAGPVLGEDFPAIDDKLMDKLGRYNLTIDHGGETSQNILKIYSLLRHYPDLKLFIHVNPIFCCPGLVSEAIFRKVERDIGIPIVSINYDGTQAPHNDILAPYIHYFQDAHARTD